VLGKSWTLFSNWKLGVLFDRSSDIGIVNSLSIVDSSSTICVDSSSLSSLLTNSKDNSSNQKPSTASLNVSPIQGDGSIIICGFMILILMKPVTGTLKV